MKCEGSIKTTQHGAGAAIHTVSGCSEYGLAGGRQLARPGQPDRALGLAVMGCSRVATGAQCWARDMTRRKAAEEVADAMPRPPPSGLRSAFKRARATLTVDRLVQSEARLWSAGGLGSRSRRPRRSGPCQIGSWRPPQCGARRSRARKNVEVKVAQCDE